MRAETLTKLRDKKVPKMTDTHTISGDQGYTKYRPAEPLTTHVDASTAIFRLHQTSNPYPFNVRSANSGLMLTGGLVEGEIPLDTDWVDQYAVGNSAALRIENAPNMTMRGWHHRGCWDGFRIVNSDGFVIENTWVDNCRDDAIENDYVSSGTIRNSLLESFVGMSTTGENGGSKTVVFENDLMRMMLFLYKGKPNTHGTPFKCSTVDPSHNPAIRIVNTTIAITNPNHESQSRLAVALGRMAPGVGGECTESFYLNLSDTALGGSYPDVAGAGFTLLQGATARAFWNAKRAAWLCSQGH